MNFYEYNGLGKSQSGADDNSARTKGASAFSNSQNGCDGGFESAQQAFSKYQGKSEDQLMSELSSLVAKMKADGTFDVDSLERLYRTASPMLAPAQRERMRAIIDTLKG